MFRRSRPVLPPEPTSDGPRDPNLPMLSVPQAAALGHLAERTFRAHGVPATYGGAGVLHTGSTSYGLHNLATAVVSEPWKRWPVLAERHVAAMVTAMQDDDRRARPEQKFLKLRATDDLPMGPDFDAPSGLPGIAALPALDLPTSVKELMKVEHLEPLGGLVEFRRVALENLRRLPTPRHTALQVDKERSDSIVHLFTTDDFFGASRVLVLDHVLASSLKAERPEHGCLVAVPNRHLLAVHLISGLGVIAALNALVRIAAGEQEAPGPISDAVFYLPKDGPAQRLTQRTPESVQVVVDGAFAETLQKLGSDHLG